MDLVPQSDQGLAIIVIVDAQNDLGILLDGVLTLLGIVLGLAGGLTAGTRGNQGNGNQNRDDFLHSTTSS